MAEGNLAEIEEIVKPCGLYRMKAQNIKDASAMLVRDFGGVLPSDMESLLKFPGVGRKIANLLIGDVFGLPAVVCDTHCIRICGRFGMYPESLKDPNKIEVILRELLPEGDGADFCHRIVLFGRETCTARGYDCSSCPLADLCAHGIAFRFPGRLLLPALLLFLRLLFNRLREDAAAGKLAHAQHHQQQHDHCQQNLGPLGFGFSVNHGVAASTAAARTHRVQSLAIAAVEVVVHVIQITTAALGHWKHQPYRLG
jgi:endonuclease III